jgi:large subunit ribosomal protein L9
MLDRPIKTLGLHDIRIALHAEVTPHVVVNVARSADEAARQARGEQVTGKAVEDAEEAEDAQAAEAARRAAKELFEEGTKVEDLAEATEENEEEQPGA